MVESGISANFRFISSSNPFSSQDVAKAGAKISCSPRLICLEQDVSS
jgi:hypothetical protein